MSAPCAKYKDKEQDRVGRCGDTWNGRPEEGRSRLGGTHRREGDDVYCESLDLLSDAPARSLLEIDRVKTNGEETEEQDWQVTIEQGPSGCA